MCCTPSRNSKRHLSVSPRLARARVRGKYRVYRGVEMRAPLHTRRRHEPMPLGQLWPLPCLGKLEKTRGLTHTLTHQFRRQESVMQLPAFQRVRLHLGCTRTTRSSTRGFSGTCTSTQTKPSQSGGSFGGGRAHCPRRREWRRGSAGANECESAGGGTHAHSRARTHTHTHTHLITHHNTKTQPIPHGLAYSRGAFPVCYWSTLLWVSPGRIN